MSSALDRSAAAPGRAGKRKDGTRRPGGSRWRAPARDRRRCPPAPAGRRSGSPAGPRSGCPPRSPAAVPAAHSPGWSTAPVRRGAAHRGAGQRSEQVRHVEGGAGPGEPLRRRARRQADRQPWESRGVGGQVEQGNRAFLGVARDGAGGEVLLDRIVVPDLTAGDHLGQQQGGERLGDRSEFEAGIGPDGALGGRVGETSAGDRPLLAPNHRDGHAAARREALEERAEAALEGRGALRGLRAGGGAPW